MNTNEILNGLSAEQQEELLKQLTAQKQQKDLDKRKAYEDIQERERQGGGDFTESEGFP